MDTWIWIGLIVASLAALGADAWYRDQQAAREFLAKALSIPFASVPLPFFAGKEFVSAHRAEVLNGLDHHGRIYAARQRYVVQLQVSAPVPAHVFRRAEREADIAADNLREYHRAADMFGFPVLRRPEDYSNAFLSSA
ncbi:MAG: hypothetical protein UY99_C0004G0023 [Parcubacteria group bacterium GW2011_GWA1_59_11]|nr:MAG: hypothetical protein UY99_C0004G0023 [Parcubacteria group bacterium GW2011_GWA1_59_11]